MENKPYAEFTKMDSGKQISFVRDMKQGDSKPLPDMSKKFPDIDFVELVSQQDKKPIKLATYRYPASKTKAVLVFFHGVCLHLGLCINIAEQLAKNGITFVGFEQRGHGRSEGQRGYLDDINGILKDIQLFLTKIRELYPNTPIFLMGHGAGSLMSIVTYKQFNNFKISGIIIGSPQLAQPQSNKILATISQVALKLIPNKMGMFATDVYKASKNPAASEYLKNDPLVYHQKIYANTLMQMVKLMNKSHPDTWKQLSTPPLVYIQGQIDKICDPIIGINFFESIKTSDKQCWWYSNMWNNFLMQQQCADIAQRLVKWISSHS